MEGRGQAIGILDEIVDAICAPGTCGRGRGDHANFHGPIQTIIPWASNLYTETLIEQVRAEFGADFWGFWMLGGMSGGGMGFIFAPATQGARRRSGCRRSCAKPSATGERAAVRDGAGGL